MGEVAALVERRGGLFRNVGVGVAAMVPAAIVATLWGHVEFADAIIPAAVGTLPGPDATSTAGLPAPPTSAPTATPSVQIVHAPRDASVRSAVDPAPLTKVTAGVSDIPPVALAAYQRAAVVIDATDESCHLPWELLAAIGRVESNHGRFGGSALNDDGVANPPIIGLRLDGTHGTSKIRDTDDGELDGDRHFDRAVGPMQFIPSSWSYVGVDADGDGQRDPQDIQDAALAASVYLCVGKGDLSTPAGQRTAVYRYNHDEKYVDLVMSIAHDYQTGTTATTLDETSAPGGLAPVTNTFDPAAPDEDTNQAAHHLAQQVGFGPVVAAAPYQPTDPTDPTDPAEPTDPTEPTNDPTPSPEPSDPPSPTPSDPSPPATHDGSNSPSEPADPDDSATELCEEAGVDPKDLDACVEIATELIDEAAPHNQVPTVDDLLARLEEAGITVPAQQLPDGG